jgi:hypothetical protein
MQFLALGWVRFARFGLGGGIGSGSGRGGRLRFVSGSRLVSGGKGPRVYGPEVAEYWACGHCEDEEEGDREDPAPEPEVLALVQDPDGEGLRRPAP